MKPLEVATSMQNREEPRTGNRPLGIQPKAIDKAPSIGLDRVDQTPDLSAERAMELEVRELRKENAELRSSTKDLSPGPGPRLGGVPDPSLVPRPEGTNDPNLLHKPRGFNDLTPPKEETTPQQLE
ncbi:hypothetical protein PIB30_068273 [Stylosanthes scabra]|uniref:Uncharacterized protein n=1 Tax=Stylosanthes scabra TaxID=79078 RepID=A0ABU6ZLG7_9FABA|nr:hypothetical protein [Stylosanthes scabra]